MPSITNEKWLEVAEPSPLTGNMAEAINNNFIAIASNIGPTNASAVVDPTIDDDLDAGFYQNSIWHRIDIDTVWICQDNTNGAAVWKKISTESGVAKWTMAAFGSWQLDIDGASSNGGGIVGNISESAENNIFAIVYDHGTTTYSQLDSSVDLTGWTDNFQWSADAANVEAGTPGAGNNDGDAVYFGHAIPFCEIGIKLDTPGVMATKVWEWEYWDGDSWASLTLALDNTDQTNRDGEQSFEQNGAISFVPPSDWATIKIEPTTGTLGYWIRARCVAAQITTTPIASNSAHDIVTPNAGFIAPHDGTITDIRVIDGITGTLHSGSVVKFILMNFTTGLHSGELEWTIDKRENSYSGLSLVVNQGDVLAVLVTDEDDADNDPVNVILEMNVSFN